MHLLKLPTLSLIKPLMISEHFQKTIRLYPAYLLSLISVMLLWFIHQAVASCGCTVPDYTKEPILPGKTGTIKVTYNGTGKYPGHFKKSITLRTNAKTEMLRLYIEGNMTAKDAK